MVIRRSHIVSIGLLALASSIAITEYIMYSPTISDVSEDSLFGDDVESNNDKDNNDSSDIQSGENNEDESLENNNIDDEDSSTLLDDSKKLSSSNNNDVSNISVEKLFSKENPSHSVSMRRGDTIASLLEGLGFNKTDVFKASKSLVKVFKIKNLKINQEIVVNGHRENDDSLVLDGFEFRPDVRYKIVVSRDKKGNYTSSKVDIPVTRVPRTISGSMSVKSPLNSLKQCGLKGKIANEAIRALGHVVNIKSSKSDVNFEFLYNDFYDDEGKCVGRPELIYVSALVNGRIFRVYKFEHDGISEYVDSNGMLLGSLSKNKSMLSRPLSHMKVTSGYGVRSHPILGVVKRHTGVDLSASIGTPIYATANGCVSRAGYYSGYGKYIKIRHGGSLETAYGHLSRISVRPGQQVRQGQVIGYVGTSGVSTGPHLHYEVIKNGRFINPMSVVKSEPQKLIGKQLAKFNQFKKNVNIQVVGLTPSKKSNKKVASVRKVS